MAAETITVGPMAPGVKPADAAAALAQACRQMGESEATAQAVGEAMRLALGRSSRQAVAQLADVRRVGPTIDALREAYAMLATELLFALTAAHRAGVPLESLHPDAGRSSVSPLN